MGSRNFLRTTHVFGLDSPGFPQSSMLGVLSFPIVHQIQTRTLGVVKVSLQEWRLGRLNSPEDFLSITRTRHGRWKSSRFLFRSGDFGVLIPPEAASASHRLGGLSSPTSHQNSRLGDEGAHAGVRTRVCVCAEVCLSV